MPFKIGKLFHLTHVVTDLRPVDQWYDDVFAVTRYYHGFARAAGRDASLIAIGDVIMEPMSPSRAANLKNQSVRRFHDRFGQHFHSIAFYVDDVPAISTHLGSHRFRQWDVMGNPVTPPNEKFAIWTHPKETHGQLEFAVVGTNTIDPRLQPAWSSEFWRERHPLGIERASHITVVVRDLASARHFYCDVLGAKPLDQPSMNARTQSVFVAVGEDTVIELAQPIAEGAEARDLERNGEGVHALTFKTGNLNKAAEFLRSKQMRPEADGAGSIALDAAQAYGMVVRFTDRALSGSPHA